MKRFAYAAAAIVLTGVLVVLAMAVAQRDARIGDASAIENELPYANQPAQPISSFEEEGLGHGYPASEGWPPAPIVRGNDSSLPSGFPGEIASESSRSNDISLANYTTDDSSPRNASSKDVPNNIRNSSAGERPTEPPPFSALSGTNPFNSLLAPNAGLSDLSNRNSLPPNAANIPKTLPRTTSSISDFPGNQPVSSPNSYSGFPGPTITAIPESQSISPPSLSQSSVASQPLQTDNRLSSRSFPNDEVFASPSLPSNNPLPGSGASSPQVPANAPAAIPYEQPPVATLGAPVLPTTPKYEEKPKYDAVPKYEAVPKYDAVPGLPTPRPSSNASANEPPSSYNSPSTAGSNVNGNNAPSQKQLSFSSAAPGLRQLDGAQNPSLEIRKRAPSEVQVGIPATFTVLVRNVGNATAFDVNVVDAVPKGAKLIRTTPQAQQSGSNLSWKLGEMPAGAEQTITIELEPISEGEIGSVASVNFAAQASVRTMSTQPKLVVKQLLESVVLGGDSFKILIDVTNAGTGTARNVRLEEDVPQNMRHVSGARILELSVGDLAPGESQKFDIELTAVSAGKVANILRAVGENVSANESSAPIEVISPKLQIGLEGPKLRYLERQATYTASVTNTGTALASQVYLTVFLPMGLQFNATENDGAYIPEQHAVKWLLTELAAGKTASTRLTLLPVEEGDFVLRMQANADSIRADSIEKPVRVEGQSELAFTIEDDNDPIETEGKTTYVVKIVNTGTRVDNEVQLTIDLPEGATVEHVDAPVNYQVSQRAIQFSPIPQMKSKDQQAIRVVVRHTREGTHVLRAHLKSKLRPGSVIKEESTQVYRDQ